MFAPLRPRCSNSWDMLRIWERSTTPISSHFTRQRQHSRWRAVAAVLCVCFFFFSDPIICQWWIARSITNSMTTCWRGTQRWVFTKYLHSLSACLSFYCEVQRVQAPTAAEIPRLEENAGESRDNSESLSLRSRTDCANNVRANTLWVMRISKEWSLLGEKDSFQGLRKATSAQSSKLIRWLALKWGFERGFNSFLYRHCSRPLNFQIFGLQWPAQKNLQSGEGVAVLVLIHSTAIWCSCRAALLRLSLVILVQQVVETVAKYVSRMQHDATSDSNILHCSALQCCPMLHHHPEFWYYFLIGFLLSSRKTLWPSRFISEVPRLEKDQTSA